ncbi:DUF1566 domain-containing protein [Pseudomonas capsici]|uniref:DUF1566 domain-containing protein n=1 Tax=Pseudomonas capsici TaxID=2810614 RepID=UPI0021F161AD|nr:DUF1566 domain-containing protein [Pseudomonas capsici]MCV4343271.1 DUF1566 domain-containing protein [Pseudomonas capsici]
MNAPAITPTENQELQFGQSYGGGTFIGITQEDGKFYRNIQAPKAYELTGAIGCYGKIVEGASSCADSRSNTEAFAAAGSELAQAVLDLVIGEHSDWAIPARDVLEMQYRHGKPTAESNYCSWRDGDNPSSVPPGLPYTESFPAQSDVAAFQEGGEEAFEPEWYATSTQFSAYTIYVMDFSDGRLSYDLKSGERRVRPVRRELIR